MPMTTLCRQPVKYSEPSKLQSHSLLEISSMSLTGQSPSFSILPIASDGQCLSFGGHHFLMSVSVIYTCDRANSQNISGILEKYQTGKKTINT
jgi:hypothetical protein